MLKGKSSLCVLLASLWQNFSKLKSTPTWTQTGNCISLFCCCAVYIISSLISALEKKKEQPLPISLTKCTVLWTALKPCFPYISNTKSINCLQDFKGTQSADAHAHSCALIVPFPRTNFTKNSFSHSGAVLWNSLPRDMREAKSLSQFKWLAHLNSWFFKSTVYTAFILVFNRLVVYRLASS